MLGMVEDADAPIENFIEGGGFSIPVKDFEGISNDGVIQVEFPHYSRKVKWLFENVFLLFLFFFFPFLIFFDNFLFFLF